MEEKWIPVKFHYEEDKIVFDCEMPKDNQDILITVSTPFLGTWVQKDICAVDDLGYHTSYCYYWNTDIIAWMPFKYPEPYKEE